MPRRNKEWSATEEKKLIKNYATRTIHELMLIFPGRSQEAINGKIKRLKSEGKITKEKQEDVIKRSYEQRGRDIIMIVDQ
jgi:hypothetical protein